MPWESSSAVPIPQTASSTSSSSYHSYSSSRSSVATFSFTLDRTYLVKTSTLRPTIAQTGTATSDTVNTTFTDVSSDTITLTTTFSRSRETSSSQSSSGSSSFNRSIGATSLILSSVGFESASGITTYGSQTSSSYTFSEQTDGDTTFDTYGIDVQTSEFPDASPAASTVGSTSYTSRTENASSSGNTTYNTNTLTSGQVVSDNTKVNTVQYVYASLTLDSTSEVSNNGLDSFSSTFTSTITGIAKNGATISTTFTATRVSFDTVTTFQTTSKSPPTRQYSNISVTINDNTANPSSSVIPVRIAFSEETIKSISVSAGYYTTDFESNQVLDTPSSLDKRTFHSLASPSATSSRTLVSVQSVPATTTQSVASLSQITTTDTLIDSRVTYLLGTARGQTLRSTYLTAGTFTLPFVSDLSGSTYGFSYHGSATGISTFSSLIDVGGYADSSLAEGSTTDDTVSGVNTGFLEDTSTYQTTSFTSRAVTGGAGSTDTVSQSLSAFTLNPPAVFVSGLIADGGYFGFRQNAFTDSPSGTYIIDGDEPPINLFALGLQSGNSVIAFDKKSTYGEYTISMNFDTAASTYNLAWANATTGGTFSASTLGGTVSGKAATDFVGLGHSNNKTVFLKTTAGGVFEVWSVGSPSNSTTTKTILQPGEVLSGSERSVNLATEQLQIVIYG